MANKRITDLTEATSISETDVTMLDGEGGSKKVTLKSLFEKTILSGLTTAAKNLVGAINELNTNVEKRVINSSYGSNALGLRWDNDVARLIGVVDYSEFYLVTDNKLAEKFKYATIVKTFSTGSVIIPFSELGLTSKPTVMLLQSQSTQGIIMYHYDNSANGVYITFHAKQSDGTFTAFTGDLRFCYLIVR